MGFSSVEVVRGRVAERAPAVSGAITVQGSGPTKTPTVKIVIAEPILRALDWKRGDRISILIGGGAETGKVRFQRTDTGDVKLRSEGTGTGGIIASRLIPTGGVNRRRRSTIPHSVIDKNVLEVVLPWMQGHAEEAVFTDSPDFEKKSMIEQPADVAPAADPWED